MFSLQGLGFRAFGHPGSVNLGLENPDLRCCSLYCLGGSEALPRVWVSGVWGLEFRVLSFD